MSMGQPQLGAASSAVHVGQHVGKRCVLGACLEDRDDDLEERPFQLSFDKKYIPPGVDLRRWMSPVEDEGLLGTCVASALAGAVEYLVLRESRVQADVSRLFIYYNQRLWTNQVRHDAGASLRDGIRVLQRLGVPHEKMWPYTFDNLAVQPPESIYRAAHDHRITDYCKVPVELDALRGCLAGGIPIAFGTHVWSSFTDLGPDGMVRMPQAGDRGEGRHAMLIVGYCDRSQVFIVRNSWGTDWGNGGYCYMPYQYLTNPHWTHTCWAVRTSADVTFEEAEHVQADLQVTPATPAGMPTAESLFGAPAFNVGGGSPAAPAAALFQTPPGEVAEVRPRVAPPGLLGSLGALAMGKKSPMEIALEMATHHSKGLVARWTGSEMAGNMVSGVIGNLAPTVQSGQKLDMGTVGGAVVNAAMGGSPLGAAPAATPATWGNETGAAPAGNTSGYDPGVLMGADRVDQILQQLRTAPPRVEVRKHHWDDSYDEQSAVQPDAPSPVRSAVAATTSGATGTPAVPAAPVAAAGPLPPTPSAAAVVASGGVVAAASVQAAERPAPKRPRRAHQTQLLAVPKIEAAHARQEPPAAATPARSGPGTQVMTAMPDLRAAVAKPPKSGAEQLREHWQSLGGATGPLGRVVAGEFQLSDRQGLGLVCKNGAVVWHPERGAIELVGTLFQSWSRTGAEGGPLGYPVAPELKVSDGAWTARIARFENGLIIDWIHPGAEDIPPFTLLGGDILYQAWVTGGADRNPAGVPLAVPQDLPERGARVLPCSNGAVTWTRAEGARSLTGDGYRAWCARLAGG